MATIKHVTQSTYKESELSFEKPNTGKDLAIQGQGYSVADLVLKFRMGQPLGIKNNIPIFNGGGYEDEDPTNAPDFDINDAHEIMENIKQNKQSRKQQKEDEKQERQQLEAQILERSMSEKKQAENIAKLLKKDS